MPESPAYSTHQTLFWIRYVARYGLRWFMSGIVATNQPSEKVCRSTFVAWRSCSVSRTWLVGAKVLSLLNQSRLGRSCIHQCCEPQWFRTMSMIMPTPRWRASATSWRKLSLVPKRGSTL
jgi:hypothetical protein